MFIVTEVFSVLILIQLDNPFWVEPAVLIFLGD